MRVAVVGSRTFEDYAKCKATLDELNKKDLTIISGGAKGADTLAYRYAKEYRLPIVVHKPDWDKWKKSAGYRRNVDIVNDCDMVIAFWDGNSKGTKHTIDIAREKGKEVKVVLV